MFFESGKRTYEFKYKFSSLRALENKSGQSIASLMSDGNMGFDTMALFVWAGLIWREQTLTIKGVDSIIDTYLEDNEEHEFTDIMNLAVEAFEKAGFGAKKKKSTQIAESIAEVIAEKIE